MFVQEKEHEVRDNKHILKKNTKSNETFETHFQILNFVEIVYCCIELLIANLGWNY